MAQDQQRMPSRLADAKVGIPIDMFQDFDSIKGNPERIVETTYGRFKRKGGFSSSKLSKWKTTYYFSEENRIIRQSNTFKRKKRGEWIFKYDEQGNRVAEVMHHGDKKGLITKKDIEYDSMGRILSIHEYSTNGELWYSKQDFNYSSGGDTVQYTEVFHGGVDQDKRVYRQEEVLDSIKRMIQKSYFDSEGTLMTQWRFTYDKYSNLKSWYWQGRDSQDGSFTQSEEQVFDYEYDEYGNWIIKYKLEAQKRIPLVKRKIKYRTGRE
jgi:YD repeat-containing protein